MEEKRDWELMKSPDGTYSVYLKAEAGEEDKDYSVVFTVDKSEAKRIIEETGCIVEELPF